MTVYTYHIVKTTPGTTVGALYRPPTPHQITGLIRAECTTMMKLGAPILSPSRMQFHHLTMFAAWESEVAIDAFLAETRLGRSLASGWHVRMTFLRRYRDSVSEFSDLPESVGEQDPTAPVVAVTLARMNLHQVPRFIRWGRPVEQLAARRPGLHTFEPVHGYARLWHAALPYRTCRVDAAADRPPPICADRPRRQLHDARAERPGRCRRLPDRRL